MSKILGVIVSKIHDGFTQKIIQGVIQRACELGYRTAIFTTTIEPEYDSLNTIGELNIYNLINFDLLDGVIVLRKSFFNDYPLKYIDRLLQEKCRCPVISVGSADPVYPIVQTNHKGHFQKLTEHMITVHGCKKIYFLTGFEGSRGTLERIDGYKDAMSAHGLAFEDDWIISGDYWTESGVKLAREIISEKREKPDAIICANDTMACSIVNELIANDVRVPEDIAVAGYDTDFSACTNIPSVTTYNVPNSLLGAEAVDSLHTRITGKKELTPFVSVADDFSSDVIAGESCGCKRNYKELAKYIDEHVKPKEFNRMLYRTSNISATLSTSSTMIDYIDNFNRLTYIVDGGSKLLALCLCNDWNEKNNNKEYRTESYPPQMMCKLSKSPEKILSVEKRFPTSDMFPQLSENEVGAYYFLPLHFLDRCFGYCVLSYGDKPRVFDDTFIEWCTTIATTLEFLRVKVYVNERNTQKINMVAKAIHNRIKEDSPTVSPERMVLGYCGKEIRRIPISDVLYFRADGDEVFIHCDCAKYRSKQKLYELESFVNDNGYFRISKAVIANISKISGLSICEGGYEAVFINGEKRKVSRRRAAALKQLL